MSTRSLSSEDVRRIVEPFILQGATGRNWISERDGLARQSDGQVRHRRSRRRLRPDRVARSSSTLTAARPRTAAAPSPARIPTKVDRSAAYVARYLAKNVVAAGLADRCTIQLSYAIGVADPLSIYVDTHGTGHVPEEKLEEVLGSYHAAFAARYPRTPPAQPARFTPAPSSYGHFGRTPDADGGFSWEKTDLVDKLKDAVAA